MPYCEVSLENGVICLLHNVTTGPEYGTNKAILLGSLNEAESLADLRNSVRAKLAEVQSDVKKWKHDTYKKQMVGGCKEAKAFEDEFRKVVRLFLLVHMCYCYAGIDPWGLF